MDGSPAALVTGANAGIGTAVAERLVRDGYRLAYATRSRDDRAKNVFARLATAGDVTWVSGDLAETATPGALVEGCLAAFGRLDALVNNAGATRAKPALELEAEDVDRIFAVDVRSALLASVAAARAMEARGGSIVNVTSVHEHVPRPGFTVYAAAKAALGMITRSLALELAPHGIRVNAVAPGIIATERNREAGVLGPATPIGRAGEPADVASVVAFLASDEARYVTGASFVVDGGLLQQVTTFPPDET